MKNLENYGVQTLDEKEMQLIEGGYSWEEFKKDCRDTWNSVCTYVSNAADSFAKGFQEGQKNGQAAVH